MSEYRQVVVGVDGSENSKEALRWARIVARSLPAEIVAVNAWPPPIVWAGAGWSALPDDWRPDEDARKLLDSTVAEAYGDHPDEPVTLRVAEGGAPYVLARESAEATMLVVGTRGRGGFAGLRVGSVSRFCAEHARCPVLVVPDVPPARLGTDPRAPASGRIVVGVDGSPSSLQALRWGAYLADLTDSTVQAVLVWHLPGLWSGGAWAAVAGAWHPADDARRALERAVAEAFDENPPPGLTMKIREGHPAHSLLEASEGAIALVVGSRGRGGFTGLLLGSVSAACVGHAQTPVLVVHGSGEVPTVTPS